jgi:hypothetical protein
MEGVKSLESGNTVIGLQHPPRKKITCATLYKRSRLQVSYDLEQKMGEADDIKTNKQF